MRGCSTGPRDGHTLPLPPESWPGMRSAISPGNSNARQHRHDAIGLLRLGRSPWEASGRPTMSRMRWRGLSEE